MYDSCVKALSDGDSVLCRMAAPVPAEGGCAVVDVEREAAQ